jgi:SAM-dependent methyltransferase
LPTYSRVLRPGDYDFLDPELGFLYGMNAHLSPCPPDVPHPNRYWEYALALRCALRSGAGTFLDVGGGGGLLSPAAARCGLEVTQIDPGHFGPLVAAQAARVGRPMAFRQCYLHEHSPEEYDVVASVSVIEHTPDDVAFLEELLRRTRVGGLIVLTTDFHPSGQPRVTGHLRTYNEARLEELVRPFGTDWDLGRLGTVSWWPHPPDWSGFTPEVCDYTFASLVLQREL